jgi:hypothetical protein
MQADVRSGYSGIFRIVGLDIGRQHRILDHKKTGEMRHVAPRDLQGCAHASAHCPAAIHVKEYVF